jgi:hypothetical protein
MKAFRLLWPTLFLLMAAQTVWGYGSGGSSKACEKPSFSQFSPLDKTDVPSGSGFSFIASPNTKPETIKVVVKNIPVAIAVKPVAQGHQVSGKLPEALRETFARINIDAEGANRCKGNGGWLVNVGK